MKIIIILALLCFASFTSKAEELDPPEIMLGERLFLETRSHTFLHHKWMKWQCKCPLQKGDPALEKTTRFINLPPYHVPFTDGLYAGQSFNCRACHLVDEHLEEPKLGMRSYADYASRSPLPTRNDGKKVTVRNAPALVDATLPRRYFILHFDGEFDSLEQLVAGTLTDRNMGWLPGEKQQSTEHICKVMRQDDGSGALAKEFGGLFL